MLLRPHVPVLSPPPGFAFTLVSRSLQFGPPTAGGQDLPGVISANPSMDAWTPTPADSVVLLPVSSHQASAFPPLAQGRLLPSPEKRFLLGVPFRGCSHSVMFRPPSLLATQVAPTDMNNQLSYGSRDVYFRAPQGLLPHLTSDMLAVRIGQLTAGDLHPIRLAASSAASTV